MNCILFVIYNKTIEKRESAGRYSPSTAPADGGTGKSPRELSANAQSTDPLSTGSVFFHGLTERW